jgi:DNA invertase Pin-like site-specific DNA recombinase
VTTCGEGRALQRSEVVSWLGSGGTACARYLLGILCGVARRRIGISDTFRIGDGRVQGDRNGLARVGLRGREPLTANRSMPLESPTYKQLSTTYIILENCVDAEDDSCHSYVMETTATTAYSYVRVSGKGQLDGDGFTRQYEAITAYAAANNITIVKGFEEEGVSGTTDWEHRPAFTAMMTALLANGTRIVVVERLDRVARDLMIQESIVADFKRKGLTLISVYEPDLCSDDPSRILIRQMMGAFFQYEKSSLVAKLRGARKRKKIATGMKCEGRKAYGEREGEQEAITRILALRQEGMAIDKIAETLNAERMKSRYGGIWYGSSVRNVLLRQEGKESVSDQLRTVRKALMERKA